MVKELAAILSELKGGKYDGALIAAATWKRHDKGEQGLTILRDRETTVIACARTGEISLTITMLLGRPIPPDSETDASAPAPAGYELWKAFSKESITEFTSYVNDTNYIHQGDNPIVPGMQILAELLETPALAEVKQVALRFHQKTFAGAPVYIKWDGKKFALWSGEDIITGTIK